jgi:glycosyltransferase involved in cell wall biosynthesis
VKLLFVIDNLGTGGAQRQMVNLAVGMTRKGHLVELFCYAPGDMLAGPLREAGIRVHWHMKRGRYTPDVLLALSRLVKQSQYNLALSFMTTPNFYALTVGALAPGRHIPVVVSERFCDLPEGPALAERLVRPLYRFAAHVVTNSHHQRENLSSSYTFLQNRLSTIYNGYDLQAFAPGVGEPDNDALRILVIASVSPYKNGLCLVEALNILRRSTSLRPRVTWIGQRLMVGERLRYLQAMEQKIDEYELRPQWEWLGQRSDIAEQLRQHDVLVHPSYGEGLPNVVCEAMACGRPVIVSATLDHNKLVQDGVSGYLFDWRAPQDLADKIQAFDQATPEERHAMGGRGRRFAEANLSLDRFVADYERLFVALVDG